MKQIEQEDFSYLEDLYTIQEEMEKEQAAINTGGNTRQKWLRK